MSAVLSHDEIVFRVLLQRDDLRSKTSFAQLEQSLPKELRKRVEPDWRGYIRDEGLEFDAAFQKAIRKHLPGVYYVVMATEFLAGVAFHEALSHFLLDRPVVWRKPASSDEEIFDLADRLGQEVRSRCEKRTGTLSPQSQVATESAAPEAKEIGPRRRCAFCRRWVLVTELLAHVDRHVDPPFPGPGFSPRTARPSGSNRSEGLRTVRPKATWPWRFCRSSSAA